MNRQEQAFLNGFVKRAGEYGVSKEIACTMLKMAASTEEQEIQKMKARYGPGFEQTEVTLPPSMEARRQGVTFDKVPFGYNVGPSRVLPQGELYGEPEKYYSGIKNQKLEKIQQKYNNPQQQVQPQQPQPPQPKAAPAVPAPAPAPVNQTAQNKVTERSKMSPFFEEASKYFPGGNLTTDPQQQAELAQLTQKNRTPGAPPINVEGIKSAPQVAPGSERYNVPSNR